MRGAGGGDGGPPKGRVREEIEGEMGLRASRRHLAEDFTPEHEEFTPHWGFAEEFDKETE